MGKGYNHYSWCTCEWCKSDRLKDEYILRTNYADLVLDIFPIEKFSFTNPNALCPICGDKVFFFQNDYGSRVFFDSLGKPWPKHPCTDIKEYSTKDGKIRDTYAQNDFFIPKVAKDKVFKNDLKIHNYENRLKIIINQYGKKIVVIRGRKYLLKEDFINIPDILIITERNKNFYIETYEILSELSQQILLLKKNKNDFENLKHFGIDNDEILKISINYGVLDTKNCYDVKIENYEENMRMNLNNFLESSRDNVKFLRYVNNPDINNFKVIYKDGELFEIK